jgi:hypothetical protein
MFRQKGTREVVRGWDGTIEGGFFYADLLVDFLFFSNSLSQLRQANAKLSASTSPMRFKICSLQARTSGLGSVALQPSPREKGQPSGQSSGLCREMPQT